MELDLSHKNLQPHELKSHLDSCATVPRRVVLHHNPRLADEGTFTLAGWLSQPNVRLRLKELHVSHCSISSSGFVVLIEAIKRAWVGNRQPLWLRIERNSIDVTIAEAYVKSGIICNAPAGCSVTRCVQMERGAKPLIHCKFVEKQNATQSVTHPSTASPQTRHDTFQRPIGMGLAPYWYGYGPCVGWFVGQKQEKRSSSSSSGSSESYSYSASERQAEHCQPDPEPPAEKIYGASSKSAAKPAKRKRQC